MHVPLNSRANGIVKDTQEDRFTWHVCKKKNILKEEKFVFLQILHPFRQTERGLTHLRSQTSKETTNSMEQPGPGLCLLRIQKQQTVAFTSCRCCLNSLFIACDSLYNSGFLDDSKVNKSTSAAQCSANKKKFKTKKSIFLNSTK